MKEVAGDQVIGLVVVVRRGLLVGSLVQGRDRVQSWAWGIGIAGQMGVVNWIAAVCHVVLDADRGGYASQPGVTMPVHSVLIQVSGFELSSWGYTRAFGIGHRQILVTKNRRQTQLGCPRKIPLPVLRFTHSHSRIIGH